MTDPRFLPPQAAYVHVPFCRRRCGYCNFTVVASRDDLIDPYLRALQIELSWLNAPRHVRSLYLGGGTPSHLPPGRLRQLLDLLRQWFLPCDAFEFTVEANPADVTPECLDIFRHFGVTRVSLGVQSFQPRKLQVLERDHGPAESEAAARRVREQGMDLAVDLIFAVPGESSEEWQADLDTALRASPDHFSLYGLTFERGSRFYGRMLRGELVRVDEERERRMYEWAIDALVRAGFQHYEVSNFARPGKRCRHNEVYWTGRGYYAAGPGASRYVNGRRETNHRSVITYLKRVLAGQSPVAERELLSPEDSARERLVFALRRLEGIDVRAFAAETGYDVEQLVGAEIVPLLANGWLDNSGGRLRLTRCGLLVSDALWPAFLRV